MQPRFINHPILGTADRFSSAAERVSASLLSGLPDEEITAPIDAWRWSRVTEFGAPLAGLLVEKGGV